MGKAHCIRFRLAISAEEYLSYYRGEVREIQVTAVNNQIVRFPAGAVQQFLTRDGIFGSFEIRFDEANRLIDVKRVATGGTSD